MHHYDVDIKMTFNYIHATGARAATLTPVYHANLQGDRHDYF
jgi:hypothetical protein